MSFFGLFGPPNVEKLRVKRDALGLIGALNYNKDATIRQAATEALGEIGEAQAIQPLINALKDREDEVRSSAIGALKRIGAPAVEPLLEALEKKETRWVVEALGELGDPRAVKPLLITIENRDWSYWDVREEAKDALVKIGKPAVQLLITALKHEDSTIRQYTVKALGEIGDERALEAIRSALADQHIFVQLEAAQALAKLGSSQAIDALISTLHHREPQVRREATQALGKVDSSQATDALISALHHRDPQVRRTAVQALEERGWEPVDGEQRALRAIAIQEWDLTIKEGMAAVKPLIEALRSSDESLKRDAVDALGMIGDARAAKPLIARLKDRYASVRQLAAEVLGKLGDARAVEPLLALLNDSDGQVRRSAAESLGQIGDKRVIEPLIALLDSKDVGDQVAAAKALGHAGDAQAVVRAVRPLTISLISTASKGLIKDWGNVRMLMATLTDLLTRFTASIASEDLQEFSQLRRGYSFDRGCEGSDEVDCSQLIQLARQELIRRGENA